MLAFVHIEKAAGTSVHQLMKRWYGARYCPVERWRLTDELYSASDLRRLRRIYPRLEAIGGHWIRPCGDLEQAAPGLRWWTILREPLARCASHYQYQVQEMERTEPFERWIADPHYRNFQTRKLVGSEDADAAIRLLEERFLFVGLAEHLAESMLLLRRRLGHDEWPLVLTRENVARADAIKEDLLGDPPRRALLEEANRADRRVYDYVAGTMFPRWRAEYGEALERDLRSLRESPPAPGLDLRRRASDLKRWALYKPWLAAVRRAG